MIRRTALRILLRSLSLLLAVVTPEAAAAQASIPQPLLDAITAEYERLGLEPLLQQRIGGMTDPAVIQSTTATLSARGLARLSEEDLLARTRLLLRLDSLAGPELCAARFMSRMDTRKLGLYLRPLQGEEIQLYAGLVARALQAELRATAPVELPDQDEIQETSELMRSAMEAKTLMRFDQVMGATATASSADLCWASNTFYGTILGMKPNDRREGLRFAAFYESGLLQ